MARGFAVDVERRDGSAVVRVVGDLDVAAVPALEEALQDVEGETGAIVIDLGHLSFIDSAGLQCLLHAGVRAHRNGHRLGLRRGPRTVQRVFELTRAERILDFVD